jgi:HEAT repeat protein
MILWSPGETERLFVRGLAATLALWIGLSAYVIANRLRFDRQARRLAELARLLANDTVTSDPRRSRSPAVDRILAGLSRRRLYRMMADVDLPRPMVALFAAHALERWGLPRLVSDAGEHRGRRPWRRVSALFALGALRAEGVHAMLEDALFGGSPEVASAAVVILSRLQDHRAAAILVAGLRANAYSPSRIATQLDQFGIPIDDLLIPLLADPQASVRYWAVSLLARSSGDKLAEHIAALADDPTAPVRKVALQTLAAIHGAQAGPVALRRLTDPVSFVRSAAIRALGEVGLAATAPNVRDATARHIARLLGDSEWEVRLAAKETLVAFGPSIWREVSGELDATDRFARNGAAEVLQNLGLLDQLIDEVGRGVEPSAEVVSVIERTLREGGIGMVDAVARRSDRTLFPSLGSFLEQLTFVGVRVSE